MHLLGISGQPKEILLAFSVRVEPPTKIHSTHDSLTLQNIADMKQITLNGSRDVPPHFEKP